MTEEFYIGQIFEEMYPSEAAEWCNKNKALMTEIEPTNSGRRFKIIEIPAPTEEEIKRARIAELKSQLDGTDYKIIKCSECSLAGEEMPYDIAELHAQRQALRDEINELE